MASAETSIAFGTVDAQLSSSVLCSAINLLSCWRSTSICLRSLSDPLKFALFYQVAGKGCDFVQINQVDGAVK